MRVFRNHEFLIRKPDTAAAALRRCIDVLRGKGLGDALISYRFEDMTFSKTSAIDRVNKRFPNLAENDSNTVAGEAADMLCEIFEGIARKYPLEHAEVFIHEIPWSRIAAFPDAPEAVEKPFPGSWLGALRISNHWWISNRMQGMHASIEVQLDADGNPQPLPPPVDALLHEIGRPRPAQIEVHLSESEESALASKKERATTLMAKYDGALGDIAASLDFPHALPHPHSVGLDFFNTKVGSYKPALKDVFGPLGYSYQSSRSGNGVFVLNKKSPAGYELELSFDVGSYSRSAGGMLLVNGPGWFARAILLVTSWEDAYAAYPIVDGDTWRRILENIRVSLEYYERTFLPELEEIFR